MSPPTTTDRPIRILLADDHHLVRAGIRALLDTLEGLQVAGEAGDGAEALRLVAELEPDLVVMDVAMPELSGLQALERMRDNALDAKVVMLSMHADEEHVVRALSLGAAGYVVKDAMPDELEAAIRTVLRGEVWLPAGLPRAALAGHEKTADSNKADPVLTRRQTEVLKRLADGASTREIAGQLGLSVKTVETYRAQVMARLGIQDLPGLVRYAIRRGLSRL